MALTPSRQPLKGLANEFSAGTESGTRDAANACRAAQDLAHSSSQRHAQAQTVLSQL